jgi:divalent metal cation (Fe/Co/Zn/Cd) transporter
VTALTVSLALAQGGMLKVLRGSMKYVEMASAIVMILAGLYLAWYWWNDIQRNYDDNVTGQVIGWQENLANWVDRNQTAVVVVFIAIIVAAVVYIVTHRERHPDDA